MKPIKLALLILLAHASTAGAQCAPGIPGAGNPGCIPPTAPGSPYGQPDAAGAPSSMEPAPVWRTTWGAMALDYSNGAAGGSIQRSSKSDAIALAKERCREEQGQHCEVAIAFENQCAAISQMPGGGLINTATAADAKEAERRALSKCQDQRSCKIVASLCTYSERVR